MSNENKKCADLIKQNFDDRNQTIAEMLTHHYGQFAEKVEEMVEEFIEKSTSGSGEEPTIEEVEKFRQQCYEDSEYNEYSLMEFPLGISKYTVVKVELSWGGPADFVEAFLDENGSLFKAVYHYQDWFDGAQMNVEKTDPMWEMLEVFLETMEVSS